MGSKKRRANASLDAAPTRAAPVVHDWEKDDEELELEAQLFGTSKRSKTKSSRKVYGHTTDDEDEDIAGLGGMEDDELYTVDAPEIAFDEDEGGSDDDGGIIIDDDAENDSEASGSGSETESEEEDDSDASSQASSSSSVSAPAFGITDTSFGQTAKIQTLGQTNDIDLDNGEDVEEMDGEARITLAPGIRADSPSASSSSSSTYIANGENGSGRKRKSRKDKEKKALWVDPADELVSADLDNERRLKKLGRGKGKGGVVNGLELEKRLREQFERLHPRPEWASQRIKPYTSSLSSLLSSSKSFIDADPSTHHQNTTLGIRLPATALPQGVVDIHRLLDANHQNPATGKKDAANAGNGVVDIQWHPSTRVGVLAVAGGDRRLRFFNIDGHTNPALLTIHLPSLPLTKTTFHPSGTSLLLTGTRPYYYTYDMVTSKCLRSPRNLFGSSQTPSSPNSLTRHVFSPDGSLLAVAGRRGAVSILDWSGNGVGAVIAELRSGRGGSVADLMWTSGKELSVLGGRDGAEVEVWDIGERKVVRRWRDDRAFGGSLMRLSEDGRYTAVGSSTGIVNLYNSSSLSISGKGKSKDYSELRAEPLKSLEHLTMPITSLAFHPSSEMLVTASNAKRNRLKLYHLPSGSAYSNWPVQTTPLGRVGAVAFSPGGEYLTVGNQRGKVLLYSLKHYANA